MHEFKRSVHDIWILRWSNIFVLCEFTGQRLPWNRCVAEGNIYLHEFASVGSPAVTCLWMQMNIASSLVSYTGLHTSFTSFSLWWHKLQTFSGINRRLMQIQGTKGLMVFYNESREWTAHAKQTNPRERLNTTPRQQTPTDWNTDAWLHNTSLTCSIDSSRSEWNMTTGGI